MESLNEKIKSGKTVIVDVRTCAEFSGGHVAGSVNIPLQGLQQRMDELEKMEYVILCCASGGRSAQATELLRKRGINCENGGSWMDVNAQC